MRTPLTWQAEQSSRLECTSRLRVSTSLYTQKGKNQQTRFVSCELFYSLVYKNNLIVIGEITYSCMQIQYIYLKL